MRKPKNVFLAFLSVFFLLIVISGIQSYAQSTTGTISGRILDPKKAVMPGVNVGVKNLETNAARSGVTDEAGRFRFLALPVGRYEVTAEMSGFSRYSQSPIILALNQEAVLEIAMTVAAVEQVVTVTSDAPLLNSTTPEVGVRFDERRLEDLPTLSTPSQGGGGFRDVFAFALSAPGVSQLNAGNSSFATGTNFSVNGMRPRGNNFMVDGQDSNDPSVTGRQQIMNNTDIVQEFRLITNQFQAEYGRAAGSVVNVITKSGTNQLHGSAFWFYNSNALNSLSNLDKSAGFTKAPFRNEHQYGGTVGGPIWKDHTFFFGSVQRWTDRTLGSGVTVTGVPTEAGRQMLQQLAGDRPQVQALLRHLPAGSGQSGVVPLIVGGQSVSIPTGSLTGVASSPFDNWQWSTRIDHQFGGHQLGGRYLFNDSIQSGLGQATPPGLTTNNKNRTQAMTLSLTSTLGPNKLNELRVSWQRLASDTLPNDPRSLEIPSIEIPELGLTGFNSAVDRTAIGLAVNQPQFRFNNTFQLQENFAWTRGPHAYKFGIDFRSVEVKSFFAPTIRGRLVYPTLQSFVDDVAQTADINRPVPGISPIQYYNWKDYFFYAQDSWTVTPSFTLNYGLRYEAPGNAMTNLYDISDQQVAGTGERLFDVQPRPRRPKKNFQPRVGFAWSPRTQSDGFLGKLTGGNNLVVRGGYSRTNDFQFINLALNVASSFPFVFAISNSPGFAGAFTRLPEQLLPASNLLTRTVLADDFRSPIAEQFSLEVQRQFALNTVVRVGYVGTKGTALFQTIDGNPRIECWPIPTTGCPRVDPTRGVIRLRANAASSIYHSMQISMDRRFANGFSAGAHYTWSAFIDEASDTFNASSRGEVAVAQNSFDRHADRGRSTYDRPHRFAANFVYELPWYRNQPGLAGHVLGGWQVSSFITRQSGSPFTPLNGVDAALALTGISGLVGDATRPDLGTDLDLPHMSIEEILGAGGRQLFRQLVARNPQGNQVLITADHRRGNLGRGILRSDGFASIELSVLKSVRLTESHRLQVRADFFNLTNTRNFGIPEARVNNAGFGNQWGTDGGNRRIFVAIKYLF